MKTRSRDRSRAKRSGPAPPPPPLPGRSGGRKRKAQPTPAASVEEPPVRKRNKLSKELAQLEVILPDEVVSSNMGPRRSTRASATTSPPPRRPRMASSRPPAASPRTPIWSKQRQQALEEEEKGSISSSSDDEEDASTNHDKNTEEAPEASSQDGSNSKQEEEEQEEGENDEDNEKEDSEKDVPVKQVRVRQTRVQQERRNKSRHSTNSKTDFDTPTLEALKRVLENKLQQTAFEQLADDEVNSFMVRMHRMANEQLGRYNHDVDSEDEAYGALLQEFQTAQEDQTLGNEIFRAAVAEAGEDTNLDRRTVQWLKRRAGLQHHLNEKLAALVEPKLTSGPRTTRRMAQTKRDQRREEGLDLLGQAVDEWEQEHGIRVPTAKRVRKRKEEKKRKERPHEERGSTKRQKKEAKAARRAERGRTASREAKNLAAVKPKPPPQKIYDTPLPLQLIEWDARQKTGRKKKDSSIMAEYRDQMNDAYKKGELVQQFTPFDQLARTFYPVERPSIFDPPRKRHPDSRYAQFCTRLINCLYGNARFFATCEFFYNDMDRNWYNRNEFLEDAVKVGVPRSARLTRREWRAVRRRINGGKVRRFSPRFIGDQLNERNNYRNYIRMFQRNPLLAEFANFPYDVPATIAVGTVVTAYSRHYRILHRGTVLSYDYKNASYLVQFERQHFGREVCPDTEVATHGGPVILIEAPRDTLVHTSVDAGYIPSGSGTAAAAALLQKPGLKVINQLAKSINPTRQDNPDEAERTQAAAFLQKTAERESLATLMSVIEMALSRKEWILDALETAPAGERQHRQWLTSNLRRVDEILSIALPFQRALYGSLYLSTSSEETVASNRLLDQVSTGNVATSAMDPSDQALSLSLARGCSHTAEQLVASAVDGLEDLSDDTDVEDSRQTHVHRQLHGAARLLLATTCAQRMPEMQMDQGLKMLHASLDEASSNLLLDVANPLASPKHAVYAQATAARDDAAKDLQEAVALLQAELNAMRVKETLRI